MQRIPIAVASVQLATTAAACYTAPAGVTATINHLSLTNTTTNPVSVTLYRVPAGDQPEPANMILSSYSLAAHQTYVVASAIGLHLSAGMTLQAQASAAKAITLVGGVYETSGSP